MNPWRIPAFILLATLVASTALAMNYKDFRRSDNIVDERGLAPQIVIEDFNKSKNALDQDIIRIFRLPYPNFCPVLSKVRDKLQKLHIALQKAEKLEDILPLEERDFASQTYVQGAEVNMTNDLGTLRAAIMKENTNLKARHKRFLKGYRPADELALITRAHLMGDFDMQGACERNVNRLDGELKDFQGSFKFANKYFKTRREELFSLSDAIEDASHAHSLSSIGTDSAVAMDYGTDKPPLQKSDKLPVGVPIEVHASVATATMTTIEPGIDGESSNLVSKKNFDFYRNFIQPEQSK